MTDTPESNKAKIAFTSLFANDDAYWIPYTVGMKLERKSNEAREDLKFKEKLCAELTKQLREEQQLHVQTLNERDEWKAALLRIHNTGRGTPDEMATDIIEGIEAAKVAIALLLENEKSPSTGATEMKS